MKAAARFGGGITASLWLVGLSLLAGLSFVYILQGQAGLSAGDIVRAIFKPDGGLESSIVRFARLPRVAVAMLCGSAFAVSGVVMQTLTRNPLASPATLGVNAGAYLAVVLAAVLAPSLLTGAGWWLAFLGGLGAAVLTYALGGASRAGPARLALAGMAVSLALAAVTGALQLLFENETQGLFLWGAGTLAQADWDGAAFLWPRLSVAAGIAFLLMPHLDLLLLDEDLARGLGGRVAFARVASGLAAVLLASTAVSVVGPIAFVGLLAPHLVRLWGLRRHALLLPTAALWGAVLLVGADVLVRLLPTTSVPLPTGAATAFLGAPFIVWLARRSTGNREAGQMGVPRPRIPFPLVAGGLCLLLSTAFIAGLTLGSLSLPLDEVLASLTGTASGSAERVVITMRLPRLIVAALSGAALAGWQRPHPSGRHAQSSCRA